MTVRFVRAVFTACAFVLTLSIPAVAFADACDDAWKAYNDARKALIEAELAMEHADDAAAAPGASAAAKQAAQRATDAWFEANLDLLRKRNETDKCPPRQVEWNIGRVYHGTPVQMTFSEALDKVFKLFGLSKASGFRASRASALQAAPGSALSGLALSVLGRVEFTRAFGATTPAFLGGIRAAKPLKTHSEFLPFGEVLFGIEHCGECQTNDFAIEFGFGTNYRRPQWDRLGIVAKIEFRTLPGLGAGVQKGFFGGVSYRLAP